MSEIFKLKLSVRKIISSLRKKQQQQQKQRQIPIGNEYYNKHDGMRSFQWTVLKSEATVPQEVRIELSEGENIIRPASGLLKWTKSFPFRVDVRAVNDLLFNLLVIDMNGQAEIQYTFTWSPELKTKNPTIGIKFLKIYQKCGNNYRELVSDTLTILDEAPRSMPKFKLFNYDHNKNYELDLMCVLDIRVADFRSKIRPNLTVHALSNTSLSDFTIVCGRNEYKTHKIILAMRSVYFMKMFESGLKESTENILRIDDIEPRLVDKLIRYIYRDELFIDGSEVKSVVDLLRVAHRYLLDCLVEQCECELAKNLDINNVILFLTLSDKYDLPTLKSRAITFICDHGTEVLKMYDWKRLIKNNPDVVNEIIETMFKNRNTTSHRETSDSNKIT